MKKITTIFLLLLSINFCFSQEKNRIEFDLKEDYENYQFTPIGENGFLVYARKSEKNAAVQTWKIEQYSTDLELVNYVEFQVPSDQRTLSKYESDDYLVLAFHEYSSGEFTVCQIENKNLKIQKETGFSLKKLLSLSIRYQHPVASIMATGKKFRVLLTFDFANGSKMFNPIQIPNVSDKKLRVENFESIESTQEIIVFVNSIKGKRVVNLYAIKYTHDGVKKEVIDFGSQVEKNLNSISTTGINDDEYVYVGSYSSSSSLSNEGIYFAHSSGSKISFINYYSFADFEDFFSYLPQKKQDKIEKKKNKKENQGKELVLNYRIASHNIIESNNEYYYIGESYYPTYRTEYYTTYVNGRPTTSTRQVFDGYQYTHATLCKFNKDGEKIWDKSFTMFPSYKPFYVKRFIRSSFEDGLINLVFTTGSLIIHKSFTAEGEVVNDRKVDFIKTDDESDKIKYSSANTQFWYGNYFISYGSQTIKDKDEKAGNKKRTVYFINKIPF